MIDEKHRDRDAEELLELGYSQEEIVEDLVEATGLARSSCEAAVAEAALERKRKAGDPIVEI